MMLVNFSIRLLFIGSGLIFEVIFPNCLKYLRIGSSGTQAGILESTTLTGRDMNGVG